VNLPAACSIVALACYLGLVYVALRRGGWATVNRLFTVYLLAMAFWQVAALMVSISREPRTALNWYELMTAGASVDLIFYYFFVRAVLRMRGRDRLVYVGYAACVATVALSIWGRTYIIESVYWDACSTFIAGMGEQNPTLSASASST
jgi:hypothetical protein